MKCKNILLLSREEAVNSNRPRNNQLLELSRMDFKITMINILKNIDNQMNRM